MGNIASVTVRQIRRAMRETHDGPTTFVVDTIIIHASGVSPSLFRVQVADQEYLGPCNLDEISTLPSTPAAATAAGESVYRSSAIQTSYSTYTDAKNGAQKIIDDLNTLINDYNDNVMSSFTTTEDGVDVDLPNDDISALDAAVADWEDIKSRREDTEISLSDIESQVEDAWAKYSDYKDLLSKITEIRDKVRAALDTSISAATVYDAVVRKFIEQIKTANGDLNSQYIDQALTELNINEPGLRASIKGLDLTALMSGVEEVLADVASQVDEKRSEVEDLRLEASKLEADVSTLSEQENEALAKIQEIDPTWSPA